MGALGLFVGGVAQGCPENLPSSAASPVLVARRLSLLPGADVLVLSLFRKAHWIDTPVMPFQSAPSGWKVKPVIAPLPWAVKGLKNGMCYWYLNNFFTII